VQIRDSTIDIAAAFVKKLFFLVPKRKSALRLVGQLKNSQLSDT